MAEFMDEQESDEQVALAQRVQSHLYAAPSFPPKPSAKELRMAATQRWLASRAPRQESPLQARSPGRKPRSMASVEHKLQHGENWPVTALAFSPEGDFVATVSRDVRIWEADTAKLRVILDGHGGLVRCVLFSPDGRLLLTGSDDGTIKAWDMYLAMSLAAYSVETLTPPGHPSSTNPTGLPPMSAMHADSGRIAMANGGAGVNGAPSLGLGTAPTMLAAASSGGGSARRRGEGGGPVSPLTRLVQKVLRRHHKPVLALAITHDSKYLVSGSADKTIRVWDLGSGYCTATLRGHRGEVQALGTTPDGKTIVSGGSDRAIMMWDLATGEGKKTLKGHRGCVSCIAVSPDGQWFVSGGHDKALRVWDAASGAELAVLPAHGGVYGVLSCAISADGDYIISGGYDRLVKTWDANSGVCLATLDGHRHMVGCVAFNPKDKAVIASTSRGDDWVRVWRLAEEATLKGGGFGISAAALLARAETPIAGGGGGGGLAAGGSSRHRLADSRISADGARPRTVRW